MTDKRVGGGVRGFFSVTGERPNEEAVCKHCGQVFRLRDRTGRINYVGMNAHLSADVLKALARGEVVP